MKYQFKLGADTDGAVKLYAIYEDGSARLVDSDSEELWREWCAIGLKMTGEVGTYVDIAFKPTSGGDPDDNETMGANFWLFTGDKYYPLSGMNDFESAHETLDKAKSAARHHLKTIPSGFDPWADIFDCEKDEIVWESRKQ